MRGTGEWQAACMAVYGQGVIGGGFHWSFGKESLGERKSFYDDEATSMYSLGTLYGRERTVYISNMRYDLSNVGAQTIRPRLILGEYY